MLDAVCDEPIDYSAESLEEPTEIPEKYRKYQKEDVYKRQVNGVCSRSCK